MQLGACVKRSDGKETITGSVCVLRLPDKMFVLNRIRYFACETFIHILRKANKAAASLLASCKKTQLRETQTHLFLKLTTHGFTRLNQRKKTWRLAKENVISEMLFRFRNYN